MQTEETKEERKRRLKREANARWCAAHPEKARALSANWRAANPEKKSASNALRYATPEGLEKKRKDEERRRREVTEYRLAIAVRTRLRQALLRAVKSPGKSCRSLELLGCTADEYRLHLEGLFEPGMTWENWAADGWRIDHARPLASFDLSDPEQQREAFHFSNTRPMWASENLSKGARWPLG